MWLAGRVLVIVALLGACGRRNFELVADATEPPDACVPACTGVRCGDPDGCDGTCSGGGCCVDECTIPDDLRCNAAVQQTCTNDDADACLEWGYDVPCTAGSCRDAMACDYSGTCAPVPVSEDASFAASGASVCMAGAPAGFTWKLVESTTSAPLTIDGVDVVACVMADFGALCTPRQICAEGTSDNNMCGDDCGGTCSDCGGIGAPLVAEIRLFASPTPELSRFRAKNRVLVQQSPGTNGTCVGISPFETRYVLACRLACGASSLNIAVRMFEMMN